MSRTKKAIIAVVALALAGGGAGAVYWYRQDTGPEITSG